MRRALSLVWPPLRRSEWKIPFWLGSRRRLAKAIPVLKLVQACGWIPWVLQNRRAAEVIHIARHPGGFLNSWRSRYLADHDRGEVEAANRNRLKTIVQVASTWADRFGDIERMSVEEAELWYWRYSTETIHQAGAGSERYHLVIYEQLVADTVGTARRLYEQCGLRWRDGVERAIRTRASGSASLAAAWKTKLSAEHLELVARILEESRMEDWWQRETAVVSQPR